MTLHINMAIGWLGSICLAMCGFPQALKSFRTKSAGDITWGLLILWELGEFLTMFYVFNKIGVSMISWPLMVNYALNLLFVGVMIYYKIWPGYVTKLDWYDVVKAVHKEIRKESRPEALEILALGGDRVQSEFMAYYHSDKGNVCCLVLDHWKDEFVKRGVMDKCGHFGNNDYSID